MNYKQQLLRNRMWASEQTYTRTFPARNILVPWTGNLLGGMADATAMYHVYVIDDDMIPASAEFAHNIYIVTAALRELTRDIVTDGTGASAREIEPYGELGA